MMAAQGAVIAAVVATLQADEAVRAVLGDPVRVWDEVPVDPEFPHVLIGGCETRPLRAEAGASEHLFSLVCVSRFCGMEEARGLADEVARALDGLVVEGLVSCQVRGVQVKRNADRTRAFATLRLRVVVDQG